MDQVITRETISILATNITEADKQLSAEFNRVAHLALAQAESYIRFGPEPARQNIVKAFLSSVSKLATVDARAEIETHRSAFMGTLAQMTEITASEPEVTPTGVIDAVSHAPLPDPIYQRTVDQDNQA